MGLVELLRGQAELSREQAELLTVEVVEEARREQEVVVEVICLSVRQAVAVAEAEAEAVVGEVLEEVVEEQAGRKQPHHPQAGEADSRPGA
jgi:hypothetical protein